MMLEEEAKEDRKRREEELAREYADEVIMHNHSLRNHHILYHATFYLHKYVVLIW